MLYPDHRLCLWEIYKDKLQNLADTVEEDLPRVNNLKLTKILQMSESCSTCLMASWTSLTLIVKNLKLKSMNNRLSMLTYTGALTLGASACVLKSSADFITITTRTSQSSRNKRLFLFTTRNRLCCRGRKTLRAWRERR